MLKCRCSTDISFEFLAKKTFSSSEKNAVLCLYFCECSLERERKLCLNFFLNYLTLAQPHPKRERNPRSKILPFQQHVSLATILEACFKHGEPSSCKSFPPDFMDFNPKLTAFEEPPPTLSSPLAASTAVIWSKGWYFKMLWLACTTLLTTF